MGLLGNGFDDPQSAAIMAISGGLLRGNFGAGLLGANDAYAQHKANALKQRLVEAQIAETLAQGQERKTKAQQLQAQMDAERRRMEGLPGLYGQPGMTGGQAVPQSFAGTDVPMFSKPMGAAPMQPTPGRFDPVRALQQGWKLDDIPKLANIQDAGMPEVARTINVPGPNGEKMVLGLDKFNRPVGKPMTEFEAAQFLNLGNRQVATIPRPGMSFTMGQTADSAASLAETRRHNGITEGNAAATLAQGRAPLGYRPTANGGLEFIPGGPADPNAAKRAAPTEFQGKSATYGARAQEADKIISGLEGQYSPLAMNSKLALGRTPLVGGGLEAVGNSMLSNAGQKAEQAQRDFVNAVLRQESGAAISAAEFDNARKQYFPQPGDGKEVLAQKARNRKIAIQGFLANARPGAAEAVGSKVDATADNDPLGLRK